jgi:hypothetical protein
MEGSGPEVAEDRHRLSDDRDQRAASTGSASGMSMKQNRIHFYH